MDVQLTEAQEAYRKGDPIKIARTFRQSPVVYGGDSKQRVENPDFHPPICQTEDGAYVTEDGRQLGEDEIPEYILAQGAPPALTPEKAKKQLNMREAMLDAGVPDTDPTSQLQRMLTKQNDELKRQNAALAQKHAALESRVEALLAKLESNPPASEPVKRGPGRPRKTS